MQLLEFICMYHRRFGSLKQPVSQSFVSSVTDFRLSLVLTGTTVYKSHSAQLLYLLYDIKSVDITHFCENSDKDIFAHSVDFQDVFYMRDFPAFLMQPAFNPSQLTIFVINLCAYYLLLNISIAGYAHAVTSLSTVSLIH